jgi:hypothetical protein
MSANNWNPQPGRMDVELAKRVRFRRRIISEHYFRQFGQKLEDI